MSYKNISQTEPSITSAKRYVEFLLNRPNTLNLPAIPNHCVISYMSDVIDQLKTQHPHRSISIGITNPMQIHFFTPENSIPFAVARGLHGAPMATVQLEELIALGFKTFLVVGPAGHPTNKNIPDLHFGELLLATQAFIFEGTSLQYGRDQNSTPAEGAVEKLKTSLFELQLPFRAGFIATTDALYRETASFLENLIARQVLAIDMELSALFTVADFHHKEICALLFISDLVSTNGSWDITPSPRMYRTVVQQLTKTIQNYIGQQ